MSDELIQALSRELLAVKHQLYERIMVTEVASGEHESPEKILLDAGKRTAQEMLDAYAKRRAKYDTLPLDVAGNLVRLYQGQWTLFSGYTGTGKTAYLRQLVCHLLKAGRKVFVATLESDPEDYLVELASTAAGVEMVNEQQFSVFLATYGGQIKVWGIVGVTEHKKILATIRALALEGLDYAVIDSLMMLDVEEDDIDAQRKFASLLNASTITTRVHIILVAHPRKPMDAEAAPTVHSVAGSSKITNLAWNVLFIRRGPAPAGGDPNVTQMLLYVLKQRTRGLIGEISGWFYRLHNQFHLDGYAQQPQRYLPDEVYPASGLTDEIPEHLMNPGAFTVDQEPVRAPWEM